MSEAASIMTLPPEVRGHIFNHLAQTEIPNLRTVCRQWNQDVDDYYDFTVLNLNENSPHFKNILQLRIKTLGIAQLQNTLAFDFEGETIFKNPSVVKTLIVGTSQGKTSRRTISPANLQHLLEISSKLEHLTLNLSPSVCDFHVINEVSNNFGNLKTLEIIYDKQSPIGLENNIFAKNHNLLLEHLRAATMPKLTKLKVNFAFSGSFVTAKIRFTRQILAFLATHGRNLETLWLVLDGGPSIERDVETLEPNDAKLIKKFDRLKDIGLSLKPSPLGLESRIGLWQDLVCSQKHLVNVKIDSKFEVETPLTPVDFRLFQKLVLNNESTLVSLDIGALTISNEDGPLDLSLFQNCPELKILKLSRNTHLLARGDGPDAVNLASLPQTLCHLGLNSFRILGQDLLQLLNSISTSSSLKTMDLYRAGQGIGFGATDAILGKLCEMGVQRSSLENVYLFESVSSFSAELFGMQMNAPDFTRPIALGLKRQPGDADWTCYDRESDMW